MAEDIYNTKPDRRYTAFKDFHYIFVLYIVMTAMSKSCWVKGGLLFSGGRDREGMGPYGHPCCTEQLSALSLFCSLLVVFATELAHRDTERERRRERQRERAGSQQHAAVFATAMPMAPVHVL